MTNPHLLPKVRSDAIMASACGQECALRVGTFIGRRCAGRETTVACHVGVIGKGMATKCSDLHIAYGCSVCHDIVDGRDRTSLDVILANYPVAYANRIFAAVCETQSILIGDGIITVPDGGII